MASLLRRLKASEPTVLDEDGKQPSRQSSQGSIHWATQDTGNNRKDSGASFPRRVSRQLLIPNVPFRKRKPSAPLQLNSQDNCLFFQKLPYELREHVYLFITSTEDWKIELRKVPDDPKERKRQQKLKAKRKIQTKTSPTFAAFLSMMTTCKAVHMEMQTFLFEQAKVKVPNLLTMESFLREMPQERLAELRHLSFEVTFPYLLFHPKEGGPKPDERDPEQMNYYSKGAWTPICTAIRQMRHLRSLHIGMYAKNYQDMHPHWPDRPSEQLWAAVAEPLQSIDWCETFTVEVSWPVDDSGSQEKRQQPFVLKQKELVTSEGSDEEDGTEGEPGYDTDTDQNFTNDASAD